MTGIDDQRKRGRSPREDLRDPFEGVEAIVMGLGPRWIYRFRLHRPLLYGLAAFIAGGGAVAVFLMTGYTNWAFESIDLASAFYKVVLGGLGGGIAFVLIAFGYAGSLRQTR